jgi:hypothetical protein
MSAETCGKVVVEVEVAAPPIEVQRKRKGAILHNACSALQRNATEDELSALTNNNGRHKELNEKWKRPQLRIPRNTHFSTAFLARDAVVRVQTFIEQKIKRQ